MKNKLLAKARKFRLTWRKNRKLKPVTESIEDFKLSARDFNFLTVAAREFRVLCVNYAGKPKHDPKIENEFSKRLWEKYQGGIKKAYDNLDSERVNKEFYEKYPEKKEKLIKDRANKRALARKKKSTTVTKVIKIKKAA